MANIINRIPEKRLMKINHILIQTVTKAEGLVTPQMNLLSDNFD